MYNLMAVSACAVLTILILMKLQVGRPCRESRSVLLPVPLDVAWSRIRDFGALQAAHGRGRPLLQIDSSELRVGDGLSPGSVWRQVGRWGDRPWWSEIEIVSVEPMRRLEVTLLRDVFGTRTGLQYHRCILDLKAEDARTTKLTFRLRARTRGARLTLARTFSPERLNARLLDVGLRSLKIEFGGRERTEAEPGIATEVAATASAVAAAVPAPDFAAAAMPAGGSGSRPVAHDRV